MMRKLSILALLAVLSAPAAARWVDDKGRSTNMTFPGAQPLTLSANGHSMVEGVEAFSKVCMTTAFDKDAVAAAVETLGWNFAYRAQMVPFKSPVDVGGWDAVDGAVSVANGIFFNKLPQCNLTFVPAAPVALADVQSALSGALGAEPANAAKAIGKNGQPNRRYEPEWRLTQPDGSIFLVFARPSPTVKGAVHMAVLKKAVK